LFAVVAESFAIRPCVTTNIGELQRMRISLCASAIVLATSFMLSNVSTGQAVEYSGAEASRLAAAVNIERIKSTLKLTAAQERHWPAVENALRDLARQQAKSDEDGFVKRISRRVVSIVLNSASVQRLAVAARPLIAALDDDQKRAAVGLAHEMGLGPVVAALY
jgi:hypothetical protein